jgi:hypothetical protein
MTESDRPDTREYDVCLSFAGAQRDYAGAVAARLREKNIHVFYDEFFSVGMLGEDLVEYFDNVFRLRSRFCVVFISAEYAAKDWTVQEWRSIRNRAFHDSGVYVLPVRFDDTDLPGVQDTVCDVDARHTPAADAAELIYAKITWTSMPTPPTRDPRGQERHVQDRHVQPTAQDRGAFAGIIQHATAITNIAGDAPNGIFGPVNSVTRGTDDG